MSVAAKLLGVSPQRVYQLIKEGRLHGERRGSTWLVPQTAIRFRKTQLEESKHPKLFVGGGVR